MGNLFQRKEFKKMGMLVRVRVTCI